MASAIGRVRLLRAARRRADRMNAPTPGTPAPPDDTHRMPSGDGAGRPPAAPPPRRRWRPWKALIWLVGVPVLLVAIVAGLLYGAATTERGTGYVWRAAVAVLGGRLAGHFDGGTLATGVRLRDLAWHGGDGTSAALDRVDGQWSLQRPGSGKPWRFVVDYLHLGDVELRIVPSGTPSSPATLPHDLRVPLAFDLRDLRVERLRLREGASTTVFSRFVFRASSDGRHHEAAVERLDTPYGAVSAHVALDGVRPFPLTGDFGYAGKVSHEDVEVNGHLGGSLEALVAQVEASGMKLTGRARIEATPFAAVPLRSVTLAFDHVNPQAFAPGAPFADLTVRAQLRPAQRPPAQAAASAVGGTAARGAASSLAGTGSAVPAASAGTAGPAGASASIAASASASASAAPHTAPGGFAVAGTVSVVNAKPGAIDANLLPLVDAHADVALDATTQRIANLSVRFVKDATLTGGGTLSGRHGRFDLNVAGLDLNALDSRVRATDLAGPIDIRLDDDVQRVALDLADPKAALRAQGRVTLDPARLSFDDVRVSAGAGSIDLAGAVGHDANSTYTLKATLTDFDPMLLASPTAARGAAGQPRAAATAPGRRAASARTAPAS
ncbi:translocation and assembly module protein TamB, partial [Burkholderia sp. WAC0059]